VLKINASFSPKGVKEALEHHRKYQTSYEEFLIGIARSGVYRYKVDMNQSTVTYYGVSEQHCYVEKVSSVESDK
jgi:uncharacterized protein YbcV (DUF1398 family)